MKDSKKDVQREKLGKDKNYIQCICRRYIKDGDKS